MVLSCENSLQVLPEEVKFGVCERVIVSFCPQLTQTIRYFLITIQNHPLFGDATSPYNLSVR